jgi:hypothetical protein
MYCATELEELCSRMAPHVPRCQDSWANPDRCLCLSDDDSALPLRSETTVFKAETHLNDLTVSIHDTQEGVVPTSPKTISVIEDGAADNPLLLTADQLPLRRSLYGVAYQSTHHVRDGAFRKVVIESKRRGIVLRTRTGYYAK